MDAGLIDRFPDEEMRADPYEFYAELRDKAPVFYSDYLGSFVVTGYAEARHVLEHPEIFTSTPPRNQTKVMAKFSTEFVSMYDDAGVPTPVPTLVVNDGALHRRYRDLVDPIFSMTGTRKMEANVVEIIDQLIDAFIDKGEVELYREFCLKVPLHLVCDLLGLPRSAASVMQAAGEAAVRLSMGAGETPEGLRANHADIVAIQAYMLPFVKAAREKRPDNLLGHLIYEVTPDGDTLDDREVLSMIQILNIGGNETTTNGLGNMFEKLLHDPKLEARLRSDRSLIPRFVEEVVRLESPVCGMSRWTGGDTELGGVPIKAGSTVHIRYSAANRDERRFGCPNEVDLERPGARNHLGFAAGPHYCLGAPLARFEMKAGLERIFDRIEAMWIDPDKGPIRYGTKLQVRSVNGLPIKFRKRAATKA